MRRSLVPSLVVASLLCSGPATLFAQVAEIIVIPTGKGAYLGPTAEVGRALVQQLNKAAGTKKAALYFPAPGHPPARRGLKRKAGRQLALALRAFRTMNYIKVRKLAKSARKLYKKLMKAGYPADGYITCCHLLAAAAQFDGQDKEAFRQLNDAVLFDKRPPSAKIFNQDVLRLHQQVVSERPPRGRLTMSATPPALVWFNGKLHGLASGSVTRRAGLYLIRIYTPQHVLMQRWFRIKPNRGRDISTMLNRDDSEEPALLGQLRKETRRKAPGRAVQQVALERAAAQIILVTAQEPCSAARCQMGIFWTKDDRWYRRKQLIFAGKGKPVAVAFLKKKKKPIGPVGGITPIGGSGLRACTNNTQCGFKERCVDGRCRKPQSVTRKWWFWTIIGAAVVGTVVAISVPLASPDNPVIEVK